MKCFLIVVGALFLLDIVLIVIYLHLGKHAARTTDNDREYYDENGNHIYYDRKLIAYLERKKEKNNH